MPRIPPSPSPSSGASSSPSASSTSGPGPASTTTGATATPTPDATSATTAPSTADSSYVATGGTVSASPPGSPLRGGLPDVLLERAGARVVHGDDPGDYYCEHMFFSAQQAATTCPSIAKNPEGEPLVGFLHVPDDTWTTRAADGSYGLAERHARSWSVLGAALRGYFDDAEASVQGPVRMLLTGYGPFMSARNNPTGEMVTEVESLDAIMQAAFGRKLATSSGEVLPRAPDDPIDMQRVSYTVKTRSGDRELVLRAQRFPVDDTAIDPAEPGSVQAAMLAFAPHAVLSLGVWSGDTYKAEHHADNGGLADDGGRPRHRWGAQADTNLVNNFALARAIERGGRAQVSVPAATLLTGGDPNV